MMDGCWLLAVGLLDGGWMDAGCSENAQTRKNLAALAKERNFPARSGDFADTKKSRVSYPFAYPRQRLLPNSGKFVIWWTNQPRPVKLP